MRRIAFAAGCSLVIAAGQMVHGDPFVFVGVPPCELVSQPTKYSGRFVRVDSDLVDGGRGAFQLRADACASGERVVIDFPDGRTGRTTSDFELVRDAEFDRLMAFARVLHAPPDSLPGNIRVVVEGRFDSAHGKLFGWFVGYGHMKLFKSRLLLHRVVSVDVRPPVKKNL
ncbi:MAG TPA: hypothetical protein VGF24_09685 [Vicinamibacterales bacterium]